ncbi:HlyD family secretion protein [Rhizobium sp. RU20A]|uniref:efflux RND transporter periplasmic adaptor subunit n=1 Tax=Rhizobium sp. RU20A TaxID=1907412 RepID=UPI0009541D58|nr:efflux RND transporter periplasmic adaptor subunit [Rhizobium sp. RU20A]SIQ32115.1 HlyD family secretion protein [Rhizobium sp. RU20A]
MVLKVYEMADTLNPLLAGALLAGLSLAAAAPLQALAQDTATPAAETSAQPSAEQALPAIVVSAVTSRKMTDRVLTSGTIRAIEEVFVAPLVEGLSIRSLQADVGDTVAADQVLATLNDDQLVLQKSQLEATLAKAEAGLAQYQAALAEAQANAEEAVRTRDRNAALVKNGIVSTAIADQTRAAATAALARVNSAEQAIAVSKADIKVAETQISDIDLRLARTAVKAPVAGVISARTAKVGAIASGAGQPLFTLIRDNAIELVADLSETDIQKIKVGQPATVTVAGGTTAIEGKVRLVSPTVDPVTRLGAVHIVVSGDQGARAGMYASAEIVIREEEGLALPLSAITSGRDGSFARAVENGVVKQVKIETGIQDGGFIEIVSGLKAGDLVVAKAGAFVRDGDKIKPIRSEETQAASN